jgi:hypothetical protein
VRVVQIYIYFDHLGMQGALAERKHVVDGERVSCFVETGVPFSERKKTVPRGVISSRRRNKVSPLSHVGRRVVLSSEERKDRRSLFRFSSCPAAEVE